MVLAGDYDSKDVVELVTRMFIFMKDFEGDVPVHVPRTVATILT